MTRETDMGFSTADPVGDRQARQMDDLRRQLRAAKRRSEIAFLFAVSALLMLFLYLGVNSSDSRRIEYYEQKYGTIETIEYLESLDGDTILPMDAKE